MSDDIQARLLGAMGRLFRSHPWHGVTLGEDAPNTVTAYIEMVPTDTVKYELDKDTGILKADRPQLFSSVCPVLYGLLPQTYCAERVADLCSIRTGIPGIQGDGDPLDVCILTEKSVGRSNILMQVVPIGGLRLLDRNEADDKIIAVMKGDAAYSSWNDVSECPNSLIERLRHYFLTYKQAPDMAEKACEITHVYGREEAHEVIRRSQQDYHAHFRDIEDLFKVALKR